LFTWNKKDNEKGIKNRPSKMPKSFVEVIASGRFCKRTISKLSSQKAKNKELSANCRFVLQLTFKMI